MADIDWEDVEALYEAARAQPADKRDAFLEEACDDPAVRREVASLLEAREAATGFFDDLADAVGGSASLSSESEEKGRPPDADPLDLEGTQVGRYAIQTHLGSGGMGVVYRAHDPELDRPVVLKFLPPHLSASPEAERRFAREAKAASVLEHANIATIYETGRTEEGTAEGQRFIAMAYYEGETLREKLDREGALSVKEAVDYTRQIAAGLSRAHEAGIVHRDVKPANVMVTESGEVKLLDFGLAKAAAETRLTESGQRLGTAAYMSPEQAEGKDVDARTDLWALGALLYEMLAGERPFQGARSSAVIHAILHEALTPLGERQGEVSSELEQVVDRCLKKDPEARYSSAEALLDDLRRIGSEPGPASVEGPSSGGTGGQLSHHGWLGVTVAGLLIVGAALSWTLWPGGPTGGEAPKAEESSVAVLPFEVSGAGAEAWRDGMVTALSLNLDGAADLRAIPDRTVLAAWEEQSTSNRGTSASEALAVARDVGARYAIVGSAVQLGGTLRFGAEVREASGGERLGRVEVRGSPDSITALTNELTQRVLGVLLEKSEEQIPSVDLASITTESLPALKAFLRGERHYRAAQYEAAIGDYESATAQDSAFALAYARLGLCHGWLVNLAKSERYWRRALDLAGQLPRRERRIVRAVNLRNDGRAVAAADSLRQLTRDYPDDPSTWYFLGETLFHSIVPGGLPEAETAFGRAIELDPGMAPYHHHFMGMAISVHHDSTLAAKRIAQTPSSDSFKPYYESAVDLAFGAPPRRQAVLDSLGSNTPSHFALHHPTDGELLIRLLENWKPPVQNFLLNRVAGANLWHGHIEAAYRRANGRWDPADMACLVGYASTLSMPVPDSLIQQYVDPGALSEKAPVRQLKCTGLSLVERGRREELPAVLGLLRSKEDAEPIVKEVRGYRAFRAGNLQQAKRLWAGHNESERAGAIWRGDLYRRLGELEKAEEWYQAAWQVPLAHERLGRLYEKMGNPEKAQAAYERFIAAWENTDPELQDRVERARRRLTELSGHAAR